ncbi:MAG TPA: cobalamin-independent methionine synthase II family protein [Baekduia sp.]|nr:cobalamin-independent methionine synthase II family protein [Baekduia sp.]
MKRSTDRILTSHVGSLPRPDSLLELYRSNASQDQLQAGLRDAVADVVSKQLDAGIDVVNDGEYGKPMTEEVDYAAWASYTHGRLGGFEAQLVDFGDTSANKDLVDFPGFYATDDAGEALGSAGPAEMPVCVGAVTYEGQELVQRDIANLKAATAGAAVTESFISSLSSGGMIYQPGSHYATGEEEAVATAEAMREEYKAIADAGLIVQLDNPHLVDMYTFAYSASGDMKAFREWAEHHIELVNHSLRGIPEEQVRYHICWGSWKGPHASDLPLKDVIDLVLKVNAGLYSVEAANPRHEHEWKVWNDVKLPEGRIVMPGVVTHKTNVLEHPELVADRVVNYANAVGKENVVAGTDCGMGGRIHPEIAWAKLKVLAEGAELATKRLWK